eukprot:GILK01013390.1.p1 GENE.GILK01013390.1~~GILK01013390.1.p1  ORF type:complete len:167 (+),score=18.60 GILK01013390.1:307-807(+)
MLKDLEKTSTVDNTWSHLQKLSYPHISDIPDEWKEEFKMLRASLEGPFVSLLDEKWYARCLGLLNLNSHQIQIKTATDISSGAALFLIGSYLNHSCIPNVELAYRMSHRGSPPVAEFKATQPIQVDDEMFITYIDTTLAPADRQNSLHWNYGFHCQCPLCLQQTSS